MSVSDTSGRGSWSKEEPGPELYEWAHPSIDGRLCELALALKLPRHYPQYWMDELNYVERCFEIYEATINEKLPWSIP